MLIEKGIVRLGIEIEIAQFSPGVTYCDIADELLSKQYMLGVSDNWQETHRYGCTCSLGCGDVRSGDVLIPPLVSLTYDASLPANGAEFVTSTIILGETGIEPLQEIWEIVVKDAVWTLALSDRRGEEASPSIHLHVSATRPGSDNVPNVFEDSDTVRRDIRHVLSLYAPEFIAIASTADLKRGLTYRQPTRRENHHGFVNVKQVVPNNIVYIEWRMFEAAYSSWEYVESCAYMSATLTRAFLEPPTLNALMANGYSNPINERVINEFTARDDVDGVIGLVIPERLLFLRDLCLEQLDDDDRGRELLRDLFDKAEELSC